MRAARGEVGSELLWPAERGRFGRGFGYVRRHRPDKRHNGVDVVAEVGAVVRAAADGIVAYSDNGVRGLGNLVLIVHPNGWVTIYAHCYRTTVQAGWHVKRGERIAFVGNTGISRAPHLHFELRIDGRPVDPLAYFEGRPWIDAYRNWQEELDEGVAFDSTDHLTVGVTTQAPPRGKRAAVERKTPSRATERARATLTSSRATRIDRSAEGDHRSSSREQALRLLREGPTAADLERVQGEHFRNLLWPLRGGSLSRKPMSRGELALHGGAAFRAAADGLVVYVGDELPGRAQSIVLLHPNGWVTVYEGAEEIAVEDGQQLRRGEWIARLDEGATRQTTRFAWYVAGRKRDPRSILVQRPQ